MTSKTLLIQLLISIMFQYILKYIYPSIHFQTNEKLLLSSDETPREEINITWKENPSFLEWNYNRNHGWVRSVFSVLIPNRLYW